MLDLPPPYYSRGGIEIYCGDAEELLARIGTHGVDLVVTDPPYGISYRSRQRAIARARIAGDDAFPTELVELAIAKASRAAYVCCRWDNLYARDVPKPKAVVAWVKPKGTVGDLSHGYGRQWEAICFYPGPLHQFTKRPEDVVYAAQSGNELHPTQKPVPLIATLIATNVGDVVLDPFMGSGTTLRAAKDLGRRAIGFEIEERFCERAAKRLDQEALPLHLPRLRRRATMGTTEEMQI